MSGYKYIIVRKGNQELPFIFPAQCVHSLMFEAVKFMVKAEVLAMYPMATERILDGAVDSLEVVGAGSVTLDVGKAAGFSETLDVKSREKDSSLIQSFPYTSGLF